MKKKEKTPVQLQNELFERYPQLMCLYADFETAYQAMLQCVKNGGKLLVAGNGGSAADSEHIVGELMKSFLFHRKIDGSFIQDMGKLYGIEGEKLAEKLEGTITAIPLTSMPALTSAFANDVDAAVSFAQMTYGYGTQGDIMLGISTSGNSKNIVYAFMTAKAKGMTTIALTGGNGGRCRELADIVLCVPEQETFKIQELHLPIYHALCAMLEAELFEEK